MKLSSFGVVILVAAVGCSKASQESGAGAGSVGLAPGRNGTAGSTIGSANGSGAGSAGVPGAAAPLQARDDRAKQLLSRGAECELRQGALPLDCPESKAVGDYAFQNQNSAAVGETCAAFLRDPDVKKRLLAATCLDHLNTGAKTPYFAAVLDALEAESDDAVRDQIAWGIKSAHAMASKIDARVLALVTTFAADPKRDKAAGYLFWSFFPQYMMGSGPKPSAAAQALAIEALNRDDSGLQRTAFDSVNLLDDKPAVCAALVQAMRPDGKKWGEAAEAMASLKDACIADIPQAVQFTIERLLAGDINVRALERFDRKYELEGATRKNILAALQKAKSPGFVRKLSEWERKDIDATIAKFAKPREAPAK
ncbi:MAG: hypothetical protein KBG15_00630 [Kofleriaceae bacterium]|nr:hypothetical protein [Kofleriaceae bacterium]